MYGCSNAANARMPCLFCNLERVKDVNGKKHWANDPRSGATPNRDNQNVGPDGQTMNEDATWKPILPIPLKRVHFCTLHAFV